MFDLLLRTFANARFKARSATRDADTDHLRLEVLRQSIRQALKAAESEHSGLDRRMQDVLARAAISLGNGSDEYLTREAADTHIQNRFDKEILNGQRRLECLSKQIDAFKFLYNSFITRFPDVEPPS
jgi:hypothetical protein